MRISYATAHTWFKPVEDDPLMSFGKNARARLRATLGRIHTFDISAQINPLTEEFLSQFLPLYEERIHEKKNPVIFDIAQKTLGNPERAHLYYSMALYENEAFLGGTVFSLRHNRLSIAYRTYRTAWVSADLPANPSTYTEYEISRYACEVGKEVILHGKDRNPYGMHSSIGLALFKLSVGCRPKKSKVFEVSTLDPTRLTEDVLVLEYPGETTEDITRAYLIASPEGIEKWEPVSKYPERLSVETLPRG